MYPPTPPYEVASQRIRLYEMHEEDFDVVSEHHYAQIEEHALRTHDARMLDPCTLAKFMAA